MKMTVERWKRTMDYSLEVFGAQDEHLAGLMEEAVAAGLPDIAVTADVGRLLMILTSLTPGRLAIEVGTLGGYSGIWIARGLASDGRLITIEVEESHADFAAAQFARAGVGSKVEIRRGAALEVLTSLGSELSPGSVDVVFIDAVKTEYLAYFTLVGELIAPGGLLLADNVYGTGGAWIDDDTHPGISSLDRFNRAVASHAEFEAVAVPMRQGVLIARKAS